MIKNRSNTQFKMVLAIQQSPNEPFLFINSIFPLYKNFSEQTTSPHLWNSTDSFVTLSISINIHSDFLNKTIYFKR